MHHVFFLIEQLDPVNHFPNPFHHGTGDRRRVNQRTFSAATTRPNRFPISLDAK
jgi:hypothetical protein